MARRRLPGRHRGLLLPPPVRGDRGHGGAGRAHLGRRGGLPAAVGPAGQAQPDRGVPALGSARSHLEPGGPVATGAPGPHRTHPHPPLAPALHRGHRRGRHPGPAPGARHPGGGDRRDRHHRGSPPPGPARRRAQPRGFGPQPVGGRRASPGPVHGGRREPGGVDGQRGQPPPVVAVGPGRPTPLRRDRRGEDGRRAGQRPGRADRRPAHRRDARLDHPRERRAVVPEGSQPGPRPHGPGRGQRRPAGRRGDPGPRHRARLPAPARPHQPTRAVRGGRRPGPAAVAGPALAVGIRPGHQGPGPAPGPRGGRPAGSPPLGLPVVRPQRAHAHRGRARVVGSTLGGVAGWWLGAWPPRPCPPGTGRGWTER